MMMRLAIILLLMMFPCLSPAGGPSFTEEEFRMHRRQEARVNRLTRRWERRGARAIGELIKVAYDCKYSQLEIHTVAHELLGHQGQRAIDAIYRTQIRPCVPYDDECLWEQDDPFPCVPPQRDEARMKLLKTLYCEVLTEDEEDPSINVKWGRTLADADHPRHSMALRTFREAVHPPCKVNNPGTLCDRPGKVDCSGGVLHALAPDLLRLLEATPPSEVSLRKAIIRGLAAGRNPLAIPVLRALVRSRAVGREVIMGLGYIGGYIGESSARDEIIYYLNSMPYLREQAAAMYSLDALKVGADLALHPTLEIAVRRAIAELAALKLSLDRQDPLDFTPPDAILWHAVALMKRTYPDRPNPWIAALLLAVIRSTTVGQTRHGAASILLLHPARMTKKQRSCVEDVMARRGLPPEATLLRLLGASSRSNDGNQMENSRGDWGPSYDPRRFTPISCAATRP